MKARERRRFDGNLAFFLEAMCLHVKAGHDLSHAWEQSLSFAGDLPLSEGAPWYWKGLSARWPAESHRLWWALLEELDGAGTSLAPFLEAFAAEIRRERSRELEEFCRKLPGRLSIALLLLYLPAAFLLLFGPLLAQLPSF